MTALLAVLTGGFIALDHYGHPARWNQIKDYIWWSKVHYSFTVSDLGGWGATITGLHGDEPYWLEQIGIWIDYWKGYFGV